MCTQAWAFASGVRLVMGQAPVMNMDRFNHDVWKLHRRLFHRFVKYRKYFIRATEELPEFQQALADEIGEAAAPKLLKDKNSKTTPLRQKVTHVSVMDVVSSSSEEVSVDENDDGDSDEGEDDKEKEEEGGKEEEEEEEEKEEEEETEETEETEEEA